MFRLIPLFFLAPLCAGDAMVFLSKRDGNFDLYLHHLDSGKEQRLTTNEGWDWYPQWCPARQTFLYLSKRDGQTQVWEMKRDGTGDRKTPAPAPQSLQISPDGLKWVYTRNLGENWEVFTCAFDGSAEQRLTHSPAYEGRPRWSPDGKLILFISERDGNNELYLMKADGSDLKRLTQTAAREKYAAWSFDGRHIAFSSDRDQENGEIYIMKVDGTHIRRITHNNFVEAELAWRHKRGILVHTNQGGLDEIQLLNPDDGSWRRITNNTSYEGEPMWLPSH